MQQMDVNIIEILIDDVVIKVLSRIVVGHRKLRAFVTHGGLLSLFESVYHGIPGRWSINLV